MPDKTEDIFDKVSNKRTESQPNPDVFDAAYNKYEAKKASTNQGQLARGAMQASIGIGQGALFTSPAMGPSILGDIALPGAQEEVLKELQESDLEQQGYNKIFQHPEEDTTPPINMEAAREGMAEMQENIFGKEGFSTGLMTLPYRVFGIETSPQNFQEEVLRKAFMLTSSLSRGAGQSRASGGNRGGPPIVGPLSRSAQAKELAGISVLSLGAAAVGKVAQELYGPIGEGVADLLFFGTGALGHKLVQKYKELPTTRNKMIMKAMSPERRDSVEPFLKIAEKRNIPVSIGTIADSPFVRAVENEIAHNNLTGQEAQTFREESAKQWGNMYYEFLASSKDAAQYESAGAVAEEIRNTVLNPQQRARAQEASDLLSQAKTLLQGSEPLRPEYIAEIEDSLNSAYQNVSGSFLPSAAEKSTQNIIARGQRKLSGKVLTPAEAKLPQLEDVRMNVGGQEGLMQAQSKQEVAEALGPKSFTKEGNISSDAAKIALAKAKNRNQLGQKNTQEQMGFAKKELERIFGPEAENMFIDSEGRLRFREGVKIDGSNLIATARSLNDTISWDFPETVNVLKNTKKVIQNVLEKQYSQNPTTNMQRVAAFGVKRYKEGNAVYQKNAQLFTGERARYSKWQINADTNGDTLATSINSIAKFKQFEKDFPEAKELIGYLKRKKIDQKLEETFNQMSFRYEPGKVASKINGLGNDQFMKYVMGDSWKDFEEIARLDKFISQNATKIYSSGVAQENFAGFLTSLKAMAFIKDPIKVGLTSVVVGGMKDRYLKDAAALLHSPTLMKEAIAIAENSAQWKNNPTYWNARIERYNQSLKIKQEENGFIDEMFNVVDELKGAAKETFTKTKPPPTGNQ